MVGQAYVIVSGAEDALGPSKPSDVEMRAENTAQGDDPDCKNTTLVGRRLRKQLREINTNLDAGHCDSGEESSQTAVGFIYGCSSIWGC